MPVIGPVPHLNQERPDAKKPFPRRCASREQNKTQACSVSGHLGTPSYPLLARRCRKSARVLRTVFDGHSPKLQASDRQGEGTIIAASVGQMSNFYVACDLNAECGRVVLGTLNQGALTLSEVRRFQNLPVTDKDSLQWDIPRLYQETLDGLRAIGTYEEAVDGISCDSWAADYLLFDIGQFFDHPDLSSF